jgi:PD-(D/E)XK nuclease superfamily
MGEEPHPDPASGKVIGLAIEVHRYLGPGLLESACEDCLVVEFREHARIGLLINFNVPLLRDGIKRMVF